MLYVRILMGIAVCLLPGIFFTGCGSRSVAPTEEVDYSQVPPEEYVHVLAASGSVDSLKTLLEENPGMMDARSVRERTLLHTAALAGQDEVVKLLLSLGADPGIQDDLGSIPRELAINEGHPTTSKLLLEAETGVGAPAQ